MLILMYFIKAPDIKLGAQKEVDTYYDVCQSMFHGIDQIMLHFRGENDRFFFSSLFAPITITSSLLQRMHYFVVPVITLLCCFKYRYPVTHHQRDEMKLFQHYSCMPPQISRMSLAGVMYIALEWHIWYICHFSGGPAAILSTQICRKAVTKVVSGMTYIPYVTLASCTI